MILVDGYNLLFRCIHAGSRSLQGQREELISYINELSSSTDLDLRIVFDATYTFEELSHLSFSSISVIYTEHGQTADEYILHEVQASREPQKILVVSSDRRLSISARNHGAKTESVEKFLPYLEARARNSRKRSSPKEQSPKDIPHFDYYLKVFEERSKKEP